MPRIYVVARPSFVETELRRFLSEKGLRWQSSDDASDAEHVVEVSGRICYMSFSDDVEKVRYPNGAYIANLVSKGHESVLEHANWTFILDGVSRAFSHQLVRHRVGFAYSQLSQQYHDETEAEFVQPDDLIGEPLEIWNKATSSALENYKQIVQLTDANSEMDPERKRQLRSSARSLLPNATSTTIAVTANARAIRHFLKLRGAIVGDHEMREVSAIMLDAFSKDASNLFQDFETVVHDDGLPLTRQIG